ncbi:MAG: portal protein [Proteobacteria bacterium SG_bin5]|nr:MAG: portal protein [Proteobacteria bacterium SG_bin5]
MNIFGRKSAGRARRPVLQLAVPGLAAREAPAIGYEQQLRQLYLRNPIAQRAVRLVAESVGGAPLKLADPALGALVAARSGGQLLTETLAAQLLLHGNAYVQIIADEGGVRELFALRPERVRALPDARGWPVAYCYRLGEARQTLIAEAADGRPQIVHVKAFNPADDHYGLGCLSATAGAIAIHNAATAWNQALLDNAARPSGALVYDPADGAVLSADQIERIRAELDQGFAGAANAGRPMLLEGGLKWQALSLSPADMDFAALKAGAARDIATAFGVPPMLLGLPGDATYANYREASRALWRQTILPLADTILSALGQALAGWFADAAITIDIDRVTALAEDRERLWAQVNAADFLSAEDKRAMLGLTPKEA